MGQRSRYPFSAFRVVPAILGSALVLSATAHSQGSDTCATADPISGFGQFAFDNASATQDGGPDALCSAGGSSDIDHDVWFRWTAPTDGDFLVSTCSQTAVNTRIAVYDGGCAGAVLGCNDNACGIQSRLSFGAAGGQDYLIRVGTLPGANGGSGSFEIEELLPVLNAANGNHYYLIFDNVSWTEARDASEALSYQGHQGHLVTIADGAEDQFIYFTLNGGALGNSWLGAYQNMGSSSFSEPAGGWEWVTGEPFTYQNWQSGEPNNSGSAEHYLGYWPADRWNDYQVTDGAVGSYVVEFDTGASIGTSYCLATANSTGVPAVISASGTASISANNLTLYAHDVPVSPGAGIFIAGPASQQLPLFNGFLCVDFVGLQRINQVTPPDASGVVTQAVDYTGVSTGTAPLNVMAGTSYYYQHWYPDPAAPGTGANLSDALEIAHAP